MSNYLAVGATEAGLLRVDPETGFVDVLVHDGDLLRPAQLADLADEMRQNAASEHMDEYTRPPSQTSLARAR